MDKDIKAKWVKALRSGEYKQGMGRLHHEGRFCCLGVLADLHGMELARDGMSLATNDGYKQFDQLTGNRDVVQALWRMNDGVGRAPAKFAEIADYIEEHL